MLKSKKLFVLGLMAAVMSLFVASCDPIEPEEVTEYRVTVSSAGAGATGGGLYEEGETVYINAGTPPTGKVFKEWTSSPVVSFADKNKSATSFIMLNRAVTVTAVFEDGLPVAYKVDITNGEIWWEDEGGNLSQIPSGAEVVFEGDTLYVLSDDPEVGYVFDKWTFTPANLNIHNRNAANTMIVMPNRNVTITANYRAVQDGEAFVRYTWEAKEQENIMAIAASYDDVQWWLENVWMNDEDYADYVFTDEPLYSGSPLIPDNVYSSSIGSTEYKGVYLGIDADSYTAVCTVIDPVFEDTVDIVANYTITVNASTVAADGADKWFEIAFDVGTFLAGEDDLGWFGDEYDNPDTKQRLEKKKASRVKKIAAKKFTNKSATMEVTYYVIPRISKKK